MIACLIVRFYFSVLASHGHSGVCGGPPRCIFNQKMLESPTSPPSAPASTTVAADPTTAQHQQLAKKIENGDFAEEYFASLTGPAKRLIEVRY